MSTPSKQPTRFGYKVAVITAIAFGGFAAWPYLAKAAEQLAAGKGVSTAEVKREVAKEMKEKEKKEHKEKGFEPKSVLALADGQVLVGGKGGLQVWRDGKLTPDAGFGGLEVRGLALAKDGAVLAAAKDGLWKRIGTEWKQVQDGDFHGVSIGADGAVFLAGKMGVQKRADGQTFAVLPGTETGWKPEEKHDDHEKKSGEKSYEKKDGDKGNGKKEDKH